MIEKKFSELEHFHCGIFKDITVIVYHNQFDNDGVQSKKRFKGSKRKIIDHREN